MTTWREAHTRAAVLAGELHGDLDTPMDRPVDVFGAVARVGLVLAFAPFGRVSGMYVRTAGSQGVLLNQGHPRTRQRYTAGHELGHHSFGHQTEVDEDLEVTLQRGNVDRWPDHEKEAEAFGAWFLMPRSVIRAGMKRLGFAAIRNEFDVYALSLWLGTSYTATARQLAAARVVAYNQSERWARIPPRTIKASLAGEEVPNDLRNDIWWLQDQHDGLSIEARPGDRILLTLDEIPASGFSWRFREPGLGLRLVRDSYVDDWEPPFIGAPAREGDVAGASHPRALLLEVESPAAQSPSHLRLVKDQTWNPDSGSAQLALEISVHTPLHGIQLPEQQFALVR